MTRPLTLAALSLGAVLMTSAAAQALTAEEVWRGWQDAAAGVGLSLVAESQAADGPTLTLTGVSLAQAVPADGGMPRFALSEIVMAGQADGTVAITMGPSLTATLEGATAGTVAVNQTGLVLTARDAGAGTAYDYRADALNIVTDTTYPVDMFDGSEPQTGAFKADVGFAGLSGSYADTPGAARAFDLVLNAAALTYAIDQTDPFTGSTSAIRSDTRDVALTGKLALPAGMDIASDDPAAWRQALRDGLSVAVRMQAGATTGSNSTTGAFMAYDLTTEGGASDTALSVGAAGAELTARAEGMVFRGTSPAIPVERVELKIGPLEAAFRLPLIATAPEDYRYMVKVTDVTVNEEAWALVDPGKTLPRDPASLALDLTGRVALDVFALAASDGTEAMPPQPVLESLNIPTLSLAAAGAALEGTGAFTFDNTAGFPQPRGSADLTLTGGNALIDGLVAIGVVAEADAQNARVMLAMFMTPGAGDDVLTSKIEARDDGGIYVNGQRIQ